MCSFPSFGLSGVSGMHGTHRLWYLMAGLLVLTTAGVRMLTLSRAHAVVPPSMSDVQAGEVLFVHEWQAGDSLSPGGDGLGPVFNATSCVACHHQGGAGGSGGLEHNVTNFVVRSDKPGEAPRQGTVHAFGVGGIQETLRDVHRDLPMVSQPTLEQLVQLPGSSRHCLRFPPPVHISQRNTPALFGIALIDAIPEREIIAIERAQRLRSGMAPADGEDAPVGRALRLKDGRLGRFGWKGQTASLSDFVRAACANELGLGNSSQAQPRPLSMPNYESPGLDLTDQQCDQITAFLKALPRPVERHRDTPATPTTVTEGKRLFTSIGCADCHRPNLGSVDGLYSDLLLHRMGADLVGGGSYGEPPQPSPDFKSGDGPSADEWRTPPLWGVADSAPYMHDGRAATLDEAILLHGGQASRSTEKYQKLTKEEQRQLLAFLGTLRAP
jgi:CxxC motif-containing protein (DUF1111 family)